LSEIINLKHSRLPSQKVFSSLINLWLCEETCVISLENFLHLSAAIKHKHFDLLYTSGSFSVK